MIRNILLAGVTALLPTLGSAAPIGPFSDLVVFGDSLSDPGNIFAITGGTVPDPTLYPNGQFTNGNTWASQLGANFASGTNFAFGGARAVANPEPLGGDTDDNTDAIPDFAAQRDLFGLTAPSLGPNPLAAVWFGGNDLRAGLANPASLGAVISAAVTEIVTGVGDLFSRGLTDVLVFGLPNLGRIPEVTSLDAFLASIGAAPAGSAIAGATAATQGFNAALRSGLSTLTPLGNVQFLDTFALFEDILADADALRFTNTTDACILTLVPATDCATDQGFVFHDSIHPTDRVHALIAKEVRAAVVPLPAGGLLLLTALGGIVLMRRRA
ncbi:SGNH/GDSL hydrolase family protein [Roseovarius sp.]|uniref:SGNH/GDSL hydrolase family protein n=1 Tax=Roseovarius sp. TaxID=1486281 RepID=UPI003A97A590